jgi:hypothetical protein
MTKKIHYAGRIKTPRILILPGLTACCSGRKAQEILADGTHTYVVEEVTCAACLRMMAKDALLSADAKRKEESDNSSL